MKLEENGHGSDSLQAPQLNAGIPNAIMDETPAPADTTVAVADEPAKPTRRGSNDSSLHSLCESIEGSLFGHHDQVDQREELRNKVKAMVEKPVYDVFDQYHPTGFFQAVAKNKYFDRFTVFVIFTNVIYIGVVADWNNAPNLLEASLGWQIGDNLFCSFFVLELTVRFMAFRHKRDCLRDAWFVFDFFLVALMVIDTWILTLVLAVTGGTNAGSLGNASVLRILRLLRITRIARMLRSIPEVVILIKGMTAALRSVFFVMCLLILVLYAFGVALVQILQDAPSGQLLFPSVLFSMYTLVCSGMFCDNLSYTTGNVMGDSYVALAVFFVFMVICLLTILNMLIGILVSVVDEVATREKDSMKAAFGVDRIRYIMLKIDDNNDGRISKREFLRILQVPEAARLFQELDVDAVGLVDLADYIFEKGGKTQDGLSFDEFMRMIMKLRGSNIVTVRDLIDLNKSLALQMARLNSKVERITAQRMQKLRSLNKAPFMPT